MVLTHKSQSLLHLALHNLKCKEHFLIICFFFHQHSQVPSHAYSTEGLRVHCQNSPVLLDYTPELAGSDKGLPGYYLSWLVQRTLVDKGLMGACSVLAGLSGACHWSTMLPVLRLMRVLPAISEVLARRHPAYSMHVGACLSFCLSPFQIFHLTKFFS